MKNRIISTLAVFGVMAGLSFDASAFSITEYIQDAVSSGTGKFCRKGSGVFTPSIRSASGKICGSHKLLASLALYMCLDGNTENFNESQCFSAAKNTLKDELKGDAPTTAKAKEILIEQGKKAGGSVFEMVKGLVK